MEISRTLSTRSTCKRSARALRRIGKVACRGPCAGGGRAHLASVNGNIRVFAALKAEELHELTVQMSMNTPFVSSFTIPSNPVSFKSHAFVVTDYFLLKVVADFLRAQLCHLLALAENHASYLHGFGSIGSSQRGGKEIVVSLEDSRIFLERGSEESTTTIETAITLPSSPPAPPRPSGPASCRRSRASARRGRSPASTQFPYIARSSGRRRRPSARPRRTGRGSRR